MVSREEEENRADIQRGEEMRDLLAPERDRHRWFSSRDGEAW